jgi:hypothetical protein
MRKVLRFVFYSFAIIGTARIMFKYGEEAWTTDPLAAIVVGSALIYAILNLLGEAMGWER